MSFASEPNPPRCQALSDFAEYVEKQQYLRFPHTKAQAKGEATKEKDPSTSQSQEDQQHAELDELFDTLDLADANAHGIRLKDLLLGTDEDTAKQLGQHLVDLLEEGQGETVFELGFEDNGDSMGLTLDEWNTAYQRLQDAAQLAHADCQLLVTRNVGGDVEAPSSQSGKDKDCSGKVMIRRKPQKVEDVIETRIAVVGNGMPRCRSSLSLPLSLYLFLTFFPFPQPPRHRRKQWKAAILT